jgi:hypothetical protein
MQLLHILDRQLEQLINKGHPDLHAFYDALKEEKLVSEEEFAGTPRDLCLGWGK